MKVILTRACDSLWVFGNTSVLSSNASWKSLIENAEKRNLIGDSSHYQSITKTIRGG